MADLSVDLCGHSLPNPLVLASGPLTYGAEAIQAAYAAGAAAAAGFPPDAAARPQ